MSEDEKKKDVDNISSGKLIQAANVGNPKGRLRNDHVGGLVTLQAQSPSDIR